MAKKLTTYDPVEDLTTDKAIAAFMAEAFKTGDAAYIAHALGVVARAKGMAQIAGQTGLSREQLYRSFSENGNPTLKTTLVVMKALGMELSAKLPTNSRAAGVPSKNNSRLRIGLKDVNKAEFAAAVKQKPGKHSSVQ